MEFRNFSASFNLGLHVRIDLRKLAHILINTFHPSKMKSALFVSLRKFGTLHYIYTSGRCRTVSAVSAAVCLRASRCLARMVQQKYNKSTRFLDYKIVNMTAISSSLFQYHKYVGLSTLFKRLHAKSTHDCRYEPDYFPAIHIFNVNNNARLTGTIFPNLLVSIVGGSTEEETSTGMHSLLHQCESAVELVLLERPAPTPASAPVASPSPREDRPEAVAPCPTIAAPPASQAALLWAESQEEEDYLTLNTEDFNFLDQILHF